VASAGANNPCSSASSLHASLCAGLELAYQRLPGVVKTSVGYTAGQTLNPAYEEVCSGRTGHTEAVQVGGLRLPLPPASGAAGLSPLQCFSTMCCARIRPLLRNNQIGPFSTCTAAAVVLQP
jgi:hypothetical protein